ncbi:MerC domain-containing protein [Paraglaciecola sp. 2405UD69-4]|uniref:MerC domain-containing protein n=1 Tax=Paraglaciecola sp. 2405UD69-4 TaxID=3391836 RepID=UPI0039C91185
MIKAQLLADRVAVLLSSLCVIHCLITPILIIAIPSIGGVSLLKDETFHQLLLFFVVPIGIIALSIGYLHHKQKWVAALGMVALITLSSPLWIAHEHLGHYGEEVITVISSIFLVSAHTFNYYLRRQKSPRVHL